MKYLALLTLLFISHSFAETTCVENKVGTRKMQLLQTTTMVDVMNYDLVVNGETEETFSSKLNCESATMDCEYVRTESKSHFSNNQGHYRSASFDIYHLKYVDGEKYTSTEFSSETTCEIYKFFAVHY